MLDHLPRDPGHIGRLPCKHVDVSPEEGDERAFLFAVQVTADADDLEAPSPTTTSFVGTEASAASQGLDEEGPGPPMQPSTLARAETRAMYDCSAQETAPLESATTEMGPAGPGILTVRYAYCTAIMNLASARCPRIAL